jgi:lipid-binding SYLF domain-containing protein
MQPRFEWMLFFVVLIVWFFPTSAGAQTREDRTVNEAMTVLNEIMAIPTTSIPISLFKDAEGVAIIPKVIKGGFVIGARHGDGVLLVKDQQGAWHAPMFVSLTGGNIGWQVGVQSTDVILVFKTQKSIQGLLSGNLTLGADAAIAAGPVGRQAAAATDSKLGAEIYSYSRSRGLFAGVSFDGSVMRVDPMANASYYRSQTPGGPTVVPPAAQQLTKQIVRYAENVAASPSAQAGWQASPNAAVPAQNTQPNRAVIQVGDSNVTSGLTSQTGFAQQHSVNEADHVRNQLSQFARELYELLDPAWQQYLALPSQVFQNNGHPSVEDINACLVRYNAVRGDGRYASLAAHPEFQSTYGLLQHYASELSQQRPSLTLPPPPQRKP